MVKFVNILVLIRWNKNQLAIVMKKFINIL